MANPKVLAFVLAGGKGERLFPLTAFRSKPSVPVGGRYRIVDFVLSNLVNSQIYSIYLLVQYKSQSLIEHVRMNWALSSVIKDHFVTVVPPQMRMGPEWFSGYCGRRFSECGSDSAAQSRTRHHFWSGPHLQDGPASDGGFPS